MRHKCVHHARSFADENRENLKYGKEIFPEINFCREGRRMAEWSKLDAIVIKTKIALVKDRLNLSSKRTAAADVHLMESLLGPVYMEGGCPG